MHRSTAATVASADGCLRQLYGDPGPAIEPDPMPKAAFRGKQRVLSGKQPRVRPHDDFDKIAVALQHLYDRIAAEPLPRRLVNLLNRLKARH
ncbi:MAG: NepR family anti-sigma factor [Stellaceae bacterium]